MNIIYVGTITLSIIQAKITAILAAIDIVLSGGKQYRLNDTQGDVMVTRESLKNLNESLSYWCALESEITNAGAEIVSLESNR